MLQSRRDYDTSLPVRPAASRPKAEGTLVVAPRLPGPEGPLLMLREKDTEGVGQPLFGPGLLSASYHHRSACRHGKERLPGSLGGGTHGDERCWHPGCRQPLRTADD